MEYERKCGAQTASALSFGGFSEQPMSGVLQAVLSLQTALRGDASDANAWEALGAAYQAAGRLTAGIKVSLASCASCIKQDWLWFGLPSSKI